MAKNERQTFFEKMKAEFTAEKFAEYDFNALRKNQLYWTLQSFSDMSYDEWIALQSEPKDAQK